MQVFFEFDDAIFEFKFKFCQIQFHDIQIKIEELVKSKNEKSKIPKYSQGVKIAKELVNKSDNITKQRRA